MVTSFYHGEKNHYGFFTQVSNLILQSTKNKNEIIFSFEKSDAFFNSVAKIESEDIYLFGGWEHSVSFSKKELITQ